MKTRDFYFDLPEELIAQHPADRRSDSRMLVVNRKENAIIHDYTRNLGTYLKSPTVLVRNNSKVRKARVYGVTEGNRELEFLFISRIDEYHWEVMVSRSKKQHVGDAYSLPGNVRAVITDQKLSEGSNLKIIRTSTPVDESYFPVYGHMPLPPYIKREDEAEDMDRYQTIYASQVGSVAAPTAGLHMTREMEEDLASRGISIIDVTLHVGLGTFLPIRTEEIEHHSMHRETYTIGEHEAEVLYDAKNRNIPVLAMGTTSMRTLESAWEEGRLHSGTRSTQLYITPGYKFQTVDALFTNFHTPGSTLLVLVSAFGGKELMFRAYQEAVAHRYRFFSYGDAMLIL